MNFLILGDGPEETSWAQAVAGHPEHRLLAACPGLKSFPELLGGPDLDAALATAGVEAVIVGGDAELRAEGLRRAAGAGLPVISLHPPGPNADPYYQVALSRQETGSIVIPDMPARLHPGVERLRAAINGQELGPYREARYEVRAEPGENDLAGRLFPRLVDVVRRLVGEIEAVTATGDPPGDRPTEALVVHVRGPHGRRAEVRLTTGPHEPARLIVAGAEGSMALEHDPSFLGGSRLVVRSTRSGDSVTELAPWEPHDAILRALAEAVAGRDAHPDLLDGTRAMEIAEAVGRSLRRGRTIDLHYEEMTEAGTFKGVMTGLGCGLLVGVLVLVPAALAGPALGFRWTIYLAWAIPPVLFLFLLLQLLRFAVRK